MKIETMKIHQITFTKSKQDIKKCSFGFIIRITAWFLRLETSGQSILCRDEGGVIC